MADLPHPWGVYARLQQQSSHKSKVDHQYWGMDAALAAVLESVSAMEAMTQTEVERAIATSARRDRHRAQIRAVHLHKEDEIDYGAGLRAIEASQLLKRVAESVPDEDWTLLRDVAVGHEYADIAAERNVSAGSLRVRVKRLRGSLSAIIV